MKYKKLMLILSVFIICFVYIIHPYIQKNNIKSSSQGISDKIIRFHIRANSDKKEDQELKLKIRDEILGVMGEKFKNTKSLDESRVVIKDNMEEMKVIAEEVIKNESQNYDVNVSLGQDYFPLRRYGSMIFPQGQYETLLVEIGEAKGQNWWCVMFPPICFVDITHSVALELEQELGEFIEEDPPLKLKSKILELIKKIVKK